MVDAYWNRAVLQTRLGDDQEARSDLEKLLEMEMGTDVAELQLEIDGMKQER